MTEENNPSQEALLFAARMGIVVSALEFYRALEDYVESVNRLRSPMATWWDDTGKFLPSCGFRGNR